MDVLTLGYVNLFIGIAASLLFGLLYRQDTQQRKLLYWVVSGCSLILNSLLNILAQSHFALPYWLMPAAANTSTIAIHVFMLAGLYQCTQRTFKLHWLLGILLLTYAANLTDFAQASLIQRLLLNFPIIVGLNIAAIRLLKQQSDTGLRHVYNGFVFAFMFNIGQISIRYLLLLLDLSGVALPANQLLVYSFGHFGLTTFSMLIFGSCLYLVYSQQQLALLHTAERDALTGVYNRRVLEQKLQTELQRNARSGQSCSILMLDIDHFKQINDRYGHVTGDHAIRHTANVIMQQLRSYDIIFRYGGEEFLVCLPNTDTNAALNIANRIRKQLELSPLHDGRDIQLTVSIGVATYSDAAVHWQQLITQADNALYQSKKYGRNQTWHFSQLKLEAQP